MVPVFLWTRREFGDFAGIMAALLFTTLPIVLAFSGLAYTDLPTACMQFAALFAFATWLQKPSLRSTLVLGIVAALAFLAKLTTLLFLPSAAVAILLAKWLIERRTGPAQTGPTQIGLAPIDRPAHWLAKLSLAFVVAVVVVWAGYGFSVGHIREEMQVTPPVDAFLPAFSCTCSKHCPKHRAQRSPAAGSRLAAGRSHFLGAE